MADSSICSLAVNTLHEGQERPLSTRAQLPRRLFAGSQPHCHLTPAPGSRRTLTVQEAAVAGRDRGVIAQADRQRAPGAVALVLPLHLANGEAKAPPGGLLDRSSDDLVLDPWLGACETSDDRVRRRVVHHGVERVRPQAIVPA